MSRGKHYSLEEARKAKDPEGFAKANPSTGDKVRFDNALERMAHDKPVKPRTNKWGLPVENKPR